MNKKLYKTPEVVNKTLDCILDDKKNYNIFDEAIPEELQEQYQKDLSQTKEMLEAVESRKQLKDIKK